MKQVFPKILAFSLVSAALTSACVRKRPVEQKYDFDGDRWEKAQFADGREWIGQVTITNNGSNGAFGFVGNVSDAKIGHFNFTKDKLQFLETDTVTYTDTKEQRVINEWSITHSEYHQKLSGGRVSNIVTENEDISWKDKKFFKVDWANATISEKASFPWEIDDFCWKSTNTQVDANENDIGADHINFTLVVTYEQQNAGSKRCWSSERYKRGINTHQVHYKYSFMPDPKSDYKEYAYTGEDDSLIQKYGYFNTVRPTVDQYKEVKNIFLMNRWNPNKLHTYYFAKGFPEKFKWMYNDPEKGVISRTNKLFEENGLPTRFEVKEADDQHQFGDIRYSFFRWVDDDDNDSPLGYGPSTAHPRTGEILSANTTIWTSGVKFYVHRLRTLARQNEAASHGASSLLSKVGEFMGREPAEWTRATSSFVGQDDSNAAFIYAIPDFTYGVQGTMFSSDSSKDVESVDTNFIPSGLSQSTLASQGLKVAQGYQERMTSELERQKETGAARRFKLNQVQFLDDAGVGGLAAIMPTLTDEQVIDDILYQTAIHEFGHNLNLRHNFYGSVEAALHPEIKTPTLGLPYASASVMEYVQLKNRIDVPRDWQPYDKSALLYAYSSGAIDDAKTSGKIHLYCTDEQTYQNPMCNRQDYGGTPSEIVKGYIESYDQDFARRNFRDDRAYWDTGAYAWNTAETMRNMKKFLNLSKYAFKSSELPRILAGNPNLSEAGKEAFSTSIQKDMNEATKLVMAFYAAVITQADADRGFQEIYDTKTGALRYQGIYADKVFASSNLFNQSIRPFNPNEGPYLTSFAEIIETGDPEMKDFTKGILTKIFTDVGDGYVGFTTMVRANAILGTEFLKGRPSTPNAARILCYRPETVQSRLGIDVSTALPEATGVVKLDNLVNLKDPNFTQAEQEIAVRKVNGRFFVAGKGTNFLAYALLSKATDARDDSDIVELNSVFSFYTEGKAPECQ